MKHLNGLLKISIFSLIVSSAFTSVYPKNHQAHFVRNLWQDFDLMMDEHVRRMEDSYRTLIEDLQLRPAVHHSYFPKVKTELSQDDSNVIVKLTFEPAKDDKTKELINNNDIDVHLAGNNLKVLVPLAYGKTEILIDNATIKVIKTEEIKKENTQDKQKEKIASYSSSFTLEYLPDSVELKDKRIQDIKALVKENTLTLLLPKKRVAKIPVTVDQDNGQSVVIPDLNNK